ncbi:MAG: GNAT family N-acetyltransferase [Myxococcota bacterium]
MDLDIKLPDTQRRAQHADWRTVADITADAFAEDPANLYVFGNPRAIRSMMRVVAREVYVPAGYSFIHGELGATMWFPPGAAMRFGPLALLAFVLGVWRHGSKGAIRRAMVLSKQMAEHHPKEPHLYLFTIGTVSSARGQGIGKALLAPVLAACDAADVPVYLENSNPKNTGFYRAHGFDTITTFCIGGDGPVIEPMWRTPDPA